MRETTFANAMMRERHHADGEFARLLDFHAAVLATVVDGLFAVDMQGALIYVNPAAETMLGWNGGDLLGRSLDEIIGGENRDDTSLGARSVQRVFRDGIASGEQDGAFIKKDRSTLSVIFNIVPIRSGGEITGAVIVFRDASERRRADEARFHLAAVVASSDDAIVSKDLDGIIRSWNDGAQRIFGYTAEEIVGKPITTLLPPERLHEETEILRRLRRGERVDHFETVRVRKDGRPIEISVTISPIRDAMGKVIGASKIARDITARKRAEQRASFLTEANAALAEVTDYESTLQKVVSLAVPTFADWCIVDMQTPEGSARQLAAMHRDPAKLTLLHEIAQRFPPRPADTFGIVNVLRTRAPDCEFEVTETALAGRARNEEHLRLLRDVGVKSWICVPLHSHAKAIGALTFATGESGRIYVIEDLRAAEDLARRAVIAIENANLLAALKESDRRKDEFLAMLAHELRNPLAPIRDALEIMRVQGPADEELRWARDVIDRQVQQMTRLIEDLVDLSRISHGKIVLRRQTVQVATAVTQAIDASRPLIEARGHELSVAMPEQPIGVFGDSMRLAQVFANLLNNAAKYTDEGGRIWLIVERAGNEALIRVKDTGVGIPAEILPRIFEMFTQADSSLERSQGGLGIGLTLVDRLVALHGGTVQAFSDGPGKGSEFVVRLPVAEPADFSAAPVGDAKIDTPMAGQPLNILVVDDNRDGANGLAKLLRLLGHDVQTAYDGLQALGAAATAHPDVVFLDIGLPKFNGYKVAQKIRAERGRDVTLIALTGWGQESDRRRSHEVGFDHHVTKPIEFTALKKLLAEIVPSRAGQGSSDQIHPSRPAIRN